MKFHIFVLFVIIIISNSFVSAQVDSVVGQVTSSESETYGGGISGDGRFIVFESQGNLATVNPRNTDASREIFLFDYAQRRIFQITDTKSLLIDATKLPTFDNIKVDILSIRPVISNHPDSNGNYWIAFGSNATCTYPGRTTGSTTIPPIVSTTNPGSFDANAARASNPCITGPTDTPVNNLVNDGNTEMWLYKVPVVPAVTDLSAGDEIPVTDLTGGTFTQVTNSFPSRLPVSGTANSFPVIADDNHDASIDDIGGAISFTSTRDLISGGNPFPSADNDEIFAYIPGGSGILKQITTTPRGTVGSPTYNANSNISNLTGGGWRIAFLSNADKPIVGMTDSNTDKNEEIFYTDLDSGGNIGTKKQITSTTRTNAGDVVNIFNYGRRMSRDGRYIAFDSYADLGTAQPGANQAGFATFVYDTTATTAPLRQVLPRSDADSGASGGDLQRYPGFSDYDANRLPQTFVLETRMNIKPDGTIPTTSSDGLNDNAVRPAQVYSFPIPTAGTPIFTRLTKLPTPSLFLAGIQPITTDSSRRMTFNLTQTEVGTGNGDLASEVYYFINPLANAPTPASINFSTGASRLAVSASPVPTPSPTATPTPTPTPSPSPTPTPTPTPQTPPAVQGLTSGMLAIMDYDSGTNSPVVARTAIGSLERSFTLPIELSGVTMTINGAACGLKSVGRRQIVFVVPPALFGSATGTVYPVVVNNNGTVFKGNVTLVPVRPDIFTNLLSPGPGGRAKVFNSTNRVLTTEPFTVKTFRLRGSKRVPTVFRVYLTGVNSLITASVVKFRIGNVEVTGGDVDLAQTPVLIAPGVFYYDFRVPCVSTNSPPCPLTGLGDQPIVITVTVGGVEYKTRLDDTAPRLFIL